MNGLFYKRGTWEEYLEKMGEDSYHYVSRGFCGRDEINAIRPLQKILRIMRDGRPYVPYTEEDKAAFLILEEHFPWMRGFDREVMRRMKPCIFALLVHAAKTGWTEVADAIMERYSLREGELGYQRIETVDQLPSPDHLCLRENGTKLLFHYEQDKLCSAARYYRRGEDFLCAYDTRRLVEGSEEPDLRFLQSEAVKAHLQDVFDALQETVWQIRNREGAFIIAEYPQGLIAFRKLEREREYSWKGLPYQFVVLRMDSGDADFLNGSWEDFSAYFNPSDFCFGKYYTDFEEKQQERFRSFGGPLLRAAEKGKDEYARCFIRYLCGTAEEEDCEVLFQRDGVMRLVKDPAELTPESLEVTESFFQVIRWVGKSRYHCKVKVNGKEYCTAWDPWRPESFIIREHYHRVIVHLTQTQQDYMWEAVKADRTSDPVGRPRGWKEDVKDAEKQKTSKNRLS